MVRGTYRREWPNLLATPPTVDEFTLHWDDPDTAPGAPERIELLTMNITAMFDELVEQLGIDGNRALTCHLHRGASKLPTLCPFCAVAACRARAARRGERV